MIEFDRNAGTPLKILLGGVLVVLESEFFMAKKYVAMDGNEAVAYVAYRCNEVCGIYPITPSSTMAEWCDEWSAKGIKNLWGTVPSVMERYSSLF